MAVQAPRLKQAWTQGKDVAPTVLRWLAVSWSLGVWAIVPSLLRYAGVPEGFCNGRWMNLFLLHPLINQFGPHGTIIGAVVFVIGFTFQYALILAAIARLPHKGA